MPQDNYMNECYEQFKFQFRLAYTTIHHSVKKRLINDLRRQLNRGMLEDINISDSSHSARGCKSTLINDLKRLMWPLVGETVVEVCFGCVHDRPSQTEHDVCLKDDEDRLDLVFEDVFSKIRPRIEPAILHFVQNKVERLCWEKISGTIIIQDDDNTEHCCFPGKLTQCYVN